MSLRHWVLALVLLAVALHLPALAFNGGIDDERIYSVVAFEMLDGGTPYVDAVERKPPLLFWTYAAIFGAVGKYNWLGLHVAAVLWSLGTMAGLYLIGRDLFDRATGVAAAFLYGVFESWAVWRNLAFNGEIMMNLPIVWGAYLVFRRSRSAGRPALLAAGALLCLAFLLKQPAAIAAVPLGIYLLLPGYRARHGLQSVRTVFHAGMFTAGFFGTLGIVAWVLHRQGILGDAYFWTITHHDVPHGPTDPVFWIRSGRISLAFMGACAPLVLGAVVSVVGSVRRAQDRWNGRRPELTALVGLLAASLVGTSASGRFYPHYFIQLIPPLALLAAPLYAGLWTGRLALRSQGLRPRVTLAWLGLTAAAFAVSHSVGLARQPRDSEVGRYIRTHSAPDDRMFVWGQSTNLYVDARRRPASRYIATFPLTGYVFGSPLSWDPRYDTADRIVPGAWDRLREDFARHPPMFIVDADVVRPIPRYPMAAFPYLDSLVAADYRLVRRAAEGVVYRRMAAEPQAAGEAPGQ